MGKDKIMLITIKYAQ